MKKSARRLIWVMLAICCVILIYPREVSLVPEAELTVYYDGGQIGKNVEVSRDRLE